MNFNLDTGKVDENGCLWRADNWVHLSMQYGMISIFLPEKELLEFITFLSQVPHHPNGYEANYTNYVFQSEDHDVYDGDARVNIFIRDHTWVILNMNVQHIHAFMTYLYENRGG
jgi:hypothetical protein